MAEERVSDDLLADVAWRYRGGDVGMMARELQERRKAEAVPRLCMRCGATWQLGDGSHTCGVTPIRPAPPLRALPSCDQSTMAEIAQGYPGEAGCA